MRKKVLVHDKTLKEGSKRWLNRHFNDPYVLKARQEGYRCRSAFKLLALQERYGFLRPGIAVLDLGCSPGGWCQVVQRILRGSNQHFGQGTLVGIDLLPMEPIPEVSFFQGDILEESVQAFLKKRSFQVILSDMSPSCTGHGPTDALQMETLLDMIWELTQAHLSKGGSLVFKTFQGSTLPPIAKQFSKFHFAKPASSRNVSREVYGIATGFKPLEKEEMFNG
jgi:23S rRNA (uridine2552-2'-O)-methyltransferase